MDIQEALFAVTLVILYGATFMGFSTAGNLLVGHKTGDLFYPFSRNYKHHFGTRDRPISLYFLFYIVFFVTLGLISSQIMSLRSSFRAWIDKLMGTDSSRVGAPSPSSSHTSVSEMETSGKSQESGSNTSLNSKSSKSKKKKNEMKKKNELKKTKTPNVMRASVVDPKKQIMPPKPSESKTILPRPSQIKARLSRRKDPIDDKPKQIEKSQDSPINIRKSLEL